MIKHKIKFIAALAGAAMLTGCNAEAESMVTIDSIRGAVSAQGLEITREQEKMYQIIGAIDGRGMTISGCHFEFYVYDTSIKSGRDILDKLITEGLAGSRVAQHKNLAIVHFCEDGDANRQRVSEVIRSL